MYAFVTRRGFCTLCLHGENAKHACNHHAPSTYMYIIIIMESAHIEVTYASAFIHIYIIVMFRDYAIIEIVNV